MSNAQKLLDRETRKVIARVKEEMSSFYKHRMLDLDAVCAHNNISLLEGRFEDENQSGVLVKKDGQWSIIVNELDPPTRKRFTIAHELGHYFAATRGSIQAEIFLEESGNVIRDYALMKRTTEIEDGTYQIERQANMIAAEILMPGHMVEQLVESGYNQKELAAEFKVSEIAMAFKLQSMGIDSLETTE